MFGVPRDLSGTKYSQYLAEMQELPVEITTTRSFKENAGLGKESKALGFRELFVCCSSDSGEASRFGVQVCNGGHCKIGGSLGLSNLAAKAGEDTPGEYHLKV